MPDQKAIYKVQVEGRNAFWSYNAVSPTRVDVAYGRIGTKGSESYKEFPNPYKRDLWIDKKVKEQLGKGYVKDTEEGLRKETEVAEGIGPQYKIKNIIYLEQPIQLEDPNGVKSIRLSKQYDPAAGLIVELFQSWTKETEWVYLSKTHAVCLSSVKSYKESLSFNWWGTFNSDRAKALRKFLKETSQAVQTFVKNSFGMQARLLSLDGTEEIDGEATSLIVSEIKATNIGGSMIGEQVLLSFAGLGDRLLENMNYFICKKSMSERYDVRIAGTSSWAIFTLNDNGGIFSVTSDYGDYAHNWPSRGPNSLKEFLIQIDDDYLIGKITNGQQVINVQKTVESWRRQVLRARREKAGLALVVSDTDRMGGEDFVTEERARDAFRFLDSMEDESPEALVAKIYSGNPVTDILGDPMECVHERPTQARLFVERMWPPFVAILKAEIAGKFTQDVLTQGVTGSY